ncbi:hypothetical protein F442_22708 [Phytophthora nicotianae P10297]|uniref:Uncharacterized protein n=1 Tax=Phytophthora nicotianae P10297 TaxID=1317064 RepID=W2XZT4_PHYNI|nr:hypothetical protein F442_22708 [Phytophthora nicotianae P10297]
MSTSGRILVLRKPLWGGPTIMIVLPKLVRVSWMRSAARCTILVGPIWLPWRYGMSMRKLVPRRLRLACLAKTSRSSGRRFSAKVFR